MRHFLAALASLFALAAPSMAHAAPNVLFDLADVPTAVTPGPATYTLRMRYAISGNSLQNATIAIDLPPGVIPVGAGKDPAFSGGCNFDDPSDPNVANLAQDWRCSWTAANLAVPQGGLSGQVALTVVYRRWGFANGANIALNPTFSASWDNAGVSTSVGPLQASATTSISGTIDPSIGRRDWSVGVGNYGYVTLDAGANSITGILTEVLVEAANQGTSPIANGYRLDLALPPGAAFAGARRGNGEFVTTAVPGSTGTISFVSQQALGTATAWPTQDPVSGETYATNYFESAQHWFYLQVVVPCTALPVPETTGIAIDLRGTAPGIAATETSFATMNYTPGYGLNGIPAFFLCGNPTRSETRATGSGAQLGQPYEVATHLHGPTGAVPVVDAFTSTYYPRPVALREMSLNIRQGGVETLEAAGFQAWACALPDQSGPLTRADFLAATPGACTRVAFPQGSARGPVPAGTTHIVAFGPPDAAWVQADALGDVVWMPLEMRGHGFIDVCMADAAEQSFTVSSWAEASDGATVTNDNSELQQSAPVTHAPSWLNTNNPRTATRSQRQVLVFAVGGGLAPLRNPTISMPVPAGVTLLDVREATGYQQDGCVAPPLDWRLDNGVLHIANGTANAPWYHDQGCAVNGCNQGGLLYFEIDVLFNANHPFINGQVVSFQPSLTGDNVDPRWPATATHSVDVVMQVPGEKRLVLEPVCAEGEGELPLTGVATRYENSGGIAVENVVVEVPVPTVGDGSGTQVATRLASAVATRGTVTCSADGNAWSSNCDDTTRRVRVTVGTLAPYESGTLTMLFEPDATAALGAIVRHTASMTSSTLLPIETPPGPPARWGRCPGILSIDGWFDDGATPGVRDASEVGLANWVVVLTDASDPTLTFTVQLPLDGRFEVNVGPGTWNVAVQPAAADANATWGYNPAPPQNVTVPSSGRAHIDIGATCSCDDDDICTIDTCGVGGVCTTRENEENPECVAECGNGRVDAGETCDVAGGVDLGAGCIFCSCSPFGFTTTADGTCAPLCGDGHLLGDEACDDGNTNDGDGCSSNCTFETGYSCRRPEIDSCPPSTVCGEPRASWCSYADPENPGAAPSDWCALLADGRFDGIDFCGEAINCGTFDASCLEADELNDAEYMACLRGVAVCGLCRAQGPSLCTLGTLLTGGPTTVTEGGPATFTYINPTNPEHTTFDCRLNDGDWAPCDGGTVTWEDLPPGTYTIEVRSCNETRTICDETPATTTFEVVPEQVEPNPEPGPEVGPEPQPEPGAETVEDVDDGLQAMGGACGGGQAPLAWPLVLAVAALVLGAKRRRTQA